VAGSSPDDPFDPHLNDQPLGSRPISFLVLLSAVIALMLVVGGMFVERVGLAAVAGGPTLVDVPELIGADRASAERLLSEAGLVYTIGEKQNVEVPPGMVIEQRPLAGERVVDDTIVEVVLSAGDDFTRVPDIRGSPRAELDLLLMVHGLYLGDIGREDDDRAVDEVIGQYPAPGELASRGHAGPRHALLGSARRRDPRRARPARGRGPQGAARCRVPGHG
jgi:beta-lactam-binding protein with PASTA domain